MTQLTLPSPRLAQYWMLTKPRVTQLAVFCAVIGMLLASRHAPDWRIILPATIGIWLMAGAAFAVNCLFEREIDARMLRTARRGTAKGEITTTQTVLFSALIGGAGAWILYVLVNPLTMWLTLATFAGYALIYTLLLKPNTPQNIVIGGLSGAMPPALGWAAVANVVPMEAWLLVLIIFTWTPPHFWSLALYKRDDFARSGLPMLPVTHGMLYTRLNVLLYTVVLSITTVLPYLIHMSGLVYLATAVVLDAIFLRHSWRLWRDYSDALARKTFRYSIVYLSLLFAGLLLDRFLMVLGAGR